MNFLKKTDYNDKIADTKSTIPSFNDLATAAAFNAIGNDIPKVSDPVREKAYDEKML